MTEAAERYMGSSVPRKEDPALLTGRANWTDNIRLPGMFPLRVLPIRAREDHERGHLGRFESAGVVAAFTGEPFRKW